MKQAIVLIHGIGEQKPMDTLRGFVKGFLKHCPGKKAKYWSKPDPMSKLFELRRLHYTHKEDKQIKTYFYEYYWAYHVEGTKMRHLKKWFLDLLFRKPNNIPKSLLSIWLILWMLTVGIGIVFMVGGFAYLTNWFDLYPSLKPLWAMLLLIPGAIQGFLIYYVGDAARYLSPLPANITLRHKIRREGLLLLNKLHESGEEYDRIIVVGHSLGSVIGYDIISRLWDEYNTSYDLAKIGKKLSGRQDEQLQEIIRNGLPKAGGKLRPIKETEAQKEERAALEDFRDKQVDGWKEQRSLGNPWRISDFISIGSPLSHAMLLMASGRKDFKERKKQRELPTCPPAWDVQGGGYGYDCLGSYTVGSRKYKPYFPHHAAPFAVTRWTNLYFPAFGGLFGDIIGGPLSKVFGLGIKDVPVKSQSLKRFTPLSHTNYWDWSEKNRQAVETLIAALDLQDLKRFKVS